MALCYNRVITTMKARTKRIFGPVASRRLGLSLGVDIIPYKTCPLDCVYCQLGKTTDRTIIRKEYAPPGEILRELEAALKGPGRIDWITFSGSGEPTLHAGLGEMIAGAKKMTAIPVAVLTSGVLLHDPAVREALRMADLVVPDLDAGSEQVFRKVNRPHPGLNFQTVVNGLADFSSGHTGEVWLEVVLVKGVNDSASELGRIAALAAKIGPARVQLNTVVRPPAEPGAKPLTARELQSACSILQRSLRGIPVDIVAGQGGASQAARPVLESSVLAYLRRRPGTLDELCAGMGANRGAITGCLASLLKSGAVEEREFRGVGFYRMSVRQLRAPGRRKRRLPGRGS